MHALLLNQVMMVLSFCGRSFHVPGMAPERGNSEAGLNE